ncbi:MAG: FAD-dependent monooxygenase, partial [Ktedonobacterales bacterium]
MPTEQQDSRDALARRAQRPDKQRTVLDTMETACCIAGAGPAGAMLALLLARAGIPVVLLEEHMDFDRDFRGDTIHPSVMENLREIGLDGDVLALPHTEMHTITIQTDDGPLTVADFGQLRATYPFITFMPQKLFLERIIAEAARYPNFRLVLGARVEELVRAGDGEGDSVRGVVYRGQDGWHEVRALLTVGCDGRFSRLRRLGGFTPITTSPPMDVLWFRLP